MAIHQIPVMGANDVKFLKLQANNIRQEIVHMISAAGSGHTAGSLGMADVMTALYFSFLNINPKKPRDPERDYVVLSNGHICPALYATMANKGFFKKKELLTLRKLGSRLQGHPHRESLPGLETTSGPLGSGLSQAAGIALALKKDKKTNKVICLLSDGEHDEGNTWEAVILAQKYDLSNLIVIIDRNKIQIDGPTSQVMPLGSLKEKYEAFGWSAHEINGNSMEQIISALRIAEHENQKPFVIIANTTPGKGVKEFENDYTWHGKAPTKEQAEQAIKELEEQRLKILSSN